MRTNLYCLAGLLSLTQPAFALPTMQPRLRDHEIRVGLTLNDYLNPSLEPVGDAGTGNIAATVGVRGIGDHENFHFGVEGETLIGLKRTSYHYIDVGEAYAGFEAKAESTHLFAYVGRKRFAWNELDSTWSLGLFQPRFRWDYLNERENGLLGFFPGVVTKYFSATGFVTPFLIPEQGAPFEFSGGDCHSSSPWFSCPASTISIYNQPTNVSYSLSVPPVKDLVLHEGYGATVRVGDRLGPSARFAWAHKPINQLLLAFSPQINLANQNLTGTIYPRVGYHDLLSADLGFQGEGKDRLVASAVYEHPKKQSLPVTWVNEQVTDAHLYALTAEGHPLPGGKNTRLSASYFHRDGGNAPDYGTFASGASYFEPRYAFQNAVMLEGSSPILESWQNHFLASGRFVVDTIHTGNLLTLDTFYRPLPELALNIGADFLASDSATVVDFLSRYQRNDRLRFTAYYSF